MASMGQRRNSNQPRWCAVTSAWRSTVDPATHSTRGSVWPYLSEAASETPLYMARPPSSPQRPKPCSACLVLPPTPPPMPWLSETRSLVEGLRRIFE